NFSMLAALSFNGNKIITTGGGGAVLTNDEKLAEKARHLTTTAKLQHQWKFEHDQVGYNYRMPNINAALGCGQLEKLPKYLVSKRRLAEKYQSIFSDSQDEHIFKEASFAKSNYWLNAMFVEDLACRDNLLTELNQQNIICRPFWELMHRLPMFDRFPKMDLSDAVNLWETAILLPSSPGLLGL
ncbi:MAG: DegT/DnrJ/EryC1/StrS family aminotransferase, partial [Coxiellaceae bacterium]|nr:DegT/DnrJ/EryC1/StrS family aminotransferase [Coxiellaceae bacterium]